MTRNDLAVLIKIRDYTKITEWADKTGIEQMVNYYLINSNIPLSEKVENDLAQKKNPGNEEKKPKNMLLWQKKSYKKLRYNVLEIF